MGTLSITTFLTLDGVLQAPGAPNEDTSGGFTRGGWLVPHFDEAFGGFMDAIFRRPAAFLLGRGTYEIFAWYWPRSRDPEDLVATKLNTLPKHVVTSRPGLTWANSRAIAFADIGAVKAATAGELQVHGSAQLARTLLSTDLVDELNLVIAPALVGPGKRLFDGASPTGLKLLEVAGSPNGLLLCRYARDGALRTGTIPDAPA